MTRTVIFWELLLEEYESQMHYPRSQRNTKGLYCFNRADLLKNFRARNIMPTPFEILFLMNSLFSSSILYCSFSCLFLCLL